MALKNNDELTKIKKNPKHKHPHPQKRRERNNNKMKKKPFPIGRVASQQSWDLFYQGWVPPP